MRPVSNAKNAKNKKINKKIDKLFFWDVMRTMVIDSYRQLVERYLKP